MFCAEQYMGLGAHSALRLRRAALEEERRTERWAFCSKLLFNMEFPLLFSGLCPHLSRNLPPAVCEQEVISEPADATVRSLK